MTSTALLEACPLCRTTLRGEEQRCPGCGAELKPYLDNAAQSAELRGVVRELLSRGEHDRAAALLPQAARLAAQPPHIIAELEARVALARRDYPTVHRLLATLETPLAAQLKLDLAAAEVQQRQACELYNQGLTAARQGIFASAAAHLARAVELDPANASLWQLKLKCDLKALRLQQCYEDLAALDRLGARPLGFARLEALLPPTLPA